jgi:hypothetical protein
MNRELALAQISVGDFFHASATNGASLLCLTMSITEKNIQARNVATQIIYDFDRATGHADWRVCGAQYECTVDSVAPLPNDIREGLLILDRKERYAREQLAKDPEWIMPREQARLSEDEKRALLFVSQFYPDNPI